MHSTRLPFDARMMDILRRDESALVHLSKRKREEDQERPPRPFPPLPPLGVAGSILREKRRREEDREERRIPSPFATPFARFTPFTPSPPPPPPPPSLPLHELLPYGVICRIDWSAVARRCLSHPSEASLEYDADRMTHRFSDRPNALHVIVRSDPTLEAVAAAVRAYPRALTRFAETGSKFGDFGTPLSLACKNGAPRHVVRFLLRSHVAELRRMERESYEGGEGGDDDDDDDDDDDREVKDEDQDQDQDVALESGNPLSFCVDEDVSVDTFRLLFREYPQGATQPYQSGPDCLWKNPIDELLQTFIGGGNQGPVRYSDWSPSRRSSMWEKLQLLLLASERGTIADRSAFSYWSRPRTQLHALLEYVRRSHDDDPDGGDYLIVPTAGALCIALNETRLRDPSQFRARDRDGNYPLHNLLRQTWRGTPNCAYARMMVRTLLECCPDGAARRRFVVAAEDGGSERGEGEGGDLPLHAAIRNGWPHDDILAASPESLRERCPRTGLYPFQLAAAAAAAATNAEGESPPPGAAEATTTTSATNSKNHHHRSFTTLSQQPSIGADAVNATFNLLRSDPSLIHI